MEEGDFRERALVSGPHDTSARAADVTGALAAMPLTEILQNMDFARRTVRVWLQRGDDAGLIHVEHGQVVRAETREGANRQTGEGAVIALCCWSRGTFSLYFEHEPVLPNVERPTMLVLLDAMRVIDEHSGGTSEAAPVPFDDHPASTPSTLAPADGSGRSGPDSGEDVGLDDFRDGGPADVVDNRGLGSLEDGEITDALDAALGALGNDSAGDDAMADAFPGAAVHAAPDVDVTHAPADDPWALAGLAADAVVAASDVGVGAIDGSANAVPAPPATSPPPLPARERPPPLPSRRASLVTSVDLSTATTTTATTATAAPAEPPATIQPVVDVRGSDEDVFAPIAPIAPVKDELTVSVGVDNSAEAVWAPTLDPLPEVKQVRWTPRVKVALAASFRLLEEAGWWPATVTDLSIGGAFLAGTVRCAPDQRLELHMRLPRLPSDPEVVQVMAQVVRASDEGLGVRFVQLSTELAGRLATVLNEAMHGPAPAAQTPPAGEGRAHVDVDALLSAVALRERSIYELLRLDPLCPDEVLADSCQALGERIERDLVNAGDHRASSLRVLQTSLERLRPLWSDPVKRVRYDLRWGHVRAPERIDAARRGYGVSLKVLAEVWSSLYPERVRQAEALMAASPPTTPGHSAAAREADELDPFCRLYRQGSGNEGR